MGRLTDVQLQALVRNGQVIAGKSDGDGLTFTYRKAGPPPGSFATAMAGSSVG
jgi:hypothetical protein